MGGIVTYVLCVYNVGDNAPNNGIIHENNMKIVLCLFWGIIIPILVVIHCYSCAFTIATLRLLLSTITVSIAITCYYHNILLLLRLLSSFNIIHSIHDQSLVLDY